MRLQLRVPGAERGVLLVDTRVRRWRAFVSRRIMLCLPETGSKEGYPEVLPNATGAGATQVASPRICSHPQLQNPVLLMLDFLNARTDMRRKAGEIYGAIVTQARRPFFYAELGVPDTPAGRYEMVVVHLFLVLERLRGSVDAASPLPRLLVEAFIVDMDDSLRELGTGDLAVPKKVRRAATGLYERSMAYKGPLDAGDDAVLAHALAEHVYLTAEGRRARALVGYVRAANAALAATDAEQVLDGKFGFPALPVATAETR
jgi:cytochrome b pre-mRNA-processing protein 3